MDKDVKVRRFTIDDAELLVRASRATGSTTVTRNARSFLSESSVVAVVAMINSRPVWLAHANIIERPNCRMLMLYEIDVAEDYRNKGVGSALVEYLKTFCREQRIKEMFVPTNESNKAAMALYVKTGAKRENTDDVFFVYSFR